MYHWNQFKNLPSIKNLSPEEQNRRYFLHYSNSLLEKNMNNSSSNSIGSGGRINEGISMYTDVNGKNDFYIAGLIGTSKLIYKTDIFREYDLKVHFDRLGITIIDVNEIVRNGNDLYITGNFGQPNAFVGKLENCVIRSNQFDFEKAHGVIVSDKINNIHGLAYYKGYLYLASRPSGVVTPVTVCRVDCNDLSNITSAPYPNTTNYQGQTNDVLVYKDNVYTFVSRGTSGSASLVKTSLDLATFSIVLLTGTSSVNERIRTSASFVIYNDEVYLPTIRNSTTGFSRIGMQVYDLNGVAKRSVNSIIINAGSPTLTPLVHWMTIYNDKLIISNAVMGVTTSHRSLVRMDPTTLNVEDSIPIGSLITDDNSILSDGYIYLNGEVLESAQNPPAPQLIKVKYNDFSDYSVLIEPLGVNGSYGSISPDLSV